MPMPANLPLPSYQDLMWGIIAVAVVQTAAALRLSFSVAKSLRRKPPEEFLPAISVIVPCKGAPKSFEKSVRSMLNHGYAGKIEFVFSAADPLDISIETLKNIIPPGSANFRIVSSGQKPSVCSDKALNCIFGYRNAAPESRALVFADSDARFYPGWAEKVIAPLQNPETAMATAPMLPRPDSLSPGAIMAAAWITGGLPYYELMKFANGTCMAFRRETFEKLGIPDLWSKSVSEDLAASKAVNDAGLEIAYAWNASPEVPVQQSFAPALQGLNRWLTLFLHYFRRVWIAGLPLTVFKFYVYAWSACHLSYKPALALWLADFFYLALAGDALRQIAASRGAKTRRSPLIPAAGALLAQAAYVCNYLFSIFSSEVVWSGYVYKINSAFDVKAEIQKSPRCRHGRCSRR